MALTHAQVLDIIDVRPDTDTRPRMQTLEADIGDSERMLFDTSARSRR